MADERMPALVHALDDPRAAELLATVGELEMLARFDRGGAEQRAEQAVSAARELGLTELEERAQLVKADLLRRRGNVAEAGRIAQDVHRWATDNDSRRTLARSHFVLSAVFQELGDVSLALEHAVRSVDLLAEDADPAMRIDHLTRLGDCLALNGDVAARERYAEVQRVAEELGDVDRQLMVLNNRAYTETLFGDFEAALTFSTQLQDAATSHGVPLHIGRLDTVARALMGLGRLEEAEDRHAARAPSGGARRVPGRRRGCRLPADPRRGPAPARQRARRAGEPRRERAPLRGARPDVDPRARPPRAGRTARRRRGLPGRLRGAQAVLPGAHGPAVRPAGCPRPRAAGDVRDHRGPPAEPPLPGAVPARPPHRPLQPAVRRRAAAAPAPSHRRRPAVSVGLLDLDYFKRVNDTCSHEVGDDVLRTVAELLQDTEYAHADGSFAARMGGEEFLLVLVGSEPAAAARELECRARRRWPRTRGPR